jgi:hypothetical protein
MPAPLGSSRSHPYPAGEPVSIAGWEFQVLEMKRGDEAWKILQESGYGLNPSATPGREYLLVQLKVKSTHTDGQAHDLNPWDFYVTGDRAVIYSEPPFVMGPDPALEMTLDAGAETQGWLTYEVGRQEGNLILAREEYDVDMNESWHYIALDSGAAISVPEELASIQPDDLGTVRDTPAPALQAITTDNWQATILEVVRGASAQAMLAAIHKDNKVLGDGMEYVALWIKVRNISTQEKPLWIGMGHFKIVTSANQEYKFPERTVGPAPSLDGYLTAGGEMVGWVVSQAPKDDSNVVLAFDPPFERDGKRFLSIDVPASAGIQLRIGHIWLGPALVETTLIYEAGQSPVLATPAPQGQKLVVIKLNVLVVEPGKKLESSRVFLVSASGKEYGSPRAYFDGTSTFSGRLEADSSSTEGPTENLGLFFAVDQAEDLAGFQVLYR